MDKKIKWEKIVIRVIKWTFFQKIKNLFSHSAYHQYKLSPESMKESAFKFDGVTYCWQTVFYGTSGAVFLVNYMNNLCIQAESIRSKKWCECYLDDTLQEGTEDNFRDCMEAHGLILSPHKSQSGTLVVFLGLEIDAVNKTIRCTEKTFNKFTELMKKSTMYKQDSSHYMLFSDFEEAIGIIGRLAKTSIMGLTKCHHLLARLGEAMNNSNQLVELKNNEQKEISFWMQERHKLKMSQFTRGAASLEISEVDLIKKPKLETPLTSDSSGKYWGFKISILGKQFCKCGPIPEALMDSGIAVKETFAFKEMMVKLAKIKEEHPNIEGMKLAVGVDSQNLDACFTRRRAKNSQMNEILSEVYEILEKHQLLVTTYWISTLQMNTTGSDKISRKEFSEFEQKISLSEEGARFIKDVYGKIKVDVFGSPSNTLKCHYCSELAIENDSLNLRKSGLEFLSSEKFLQGTFWIVPPNNVMQETLSMLNQYDWKNAKKVQILLLVEERFVAAVRAAFQKKKGLKDLVTSRFYKKQEKATKLTVRHRQNYILFEINTLKQ